jgi:protein-disulfide isomerase
VTRRSQRALSYGMAVAVLAGTAVWLACSAAGGPRIASAKEIATVLDTRELTPSETKRLLRVLHSEVSPCGDDVSLALSLFNPEACPLAPLAARFVVQMIMEDFDEQEISAAYVARYAAAKGLEIPVDGSPRTGPEHPAATVVVFSDFECPFCAKAAERLREILRQYPNDVALVFKNFPLAIHTTAELMARAGYAAFEQGRFWEMHDTLFSASGSPVDRDRIIVMATGLGLDVKRFEEALASPGATAAIEADRNLGKKLGVDGTPVIFVNGRKLDGGVKDLEERLREEFLRRAAAGASGQ